MNIKEQVFGKSNREYWMGLSIIAVILFHIHYWYQDSFYTYFMRKGYLGVDVFFLLSSYGLSASYCHNSLCVFYLNRIKRIFPVFFFAVLCFAYIYNRGSLSETCEMVYRYCLGLSILQNNTFFWYIPATIMLYLFFPFVFFIVNKVINLHKYSYFLLLLICLFIANTSINVNRMFLIRFPIILIGVLSYILPEKNLMKLYIFAFIIGMYWNNANDIALSLSIPLFLYLVIIELKKRLPLYTFVSFIGKHSLEIYIAQFFVIEQCYVPFYVHSSLLIKTLFAIPITLLYSVLFYYLQKFSLYFIPEKLRHA